MALLKTYGLCYALWCESKNHQRSDNDPHTDKMINLLSKRPRLLGNGKGDNSRTYKTQCSAR
eukprot:1601623-Amphidinium_carterae.1